MTATILQFPTRRVHCDPELPADYEPYQTNEQREAERMRSFDAAEAYARRRDRRRSDDDGPQAA